MADLAAIRAGIAANLTSGLAASITNLTVSPYVLANPTPPVIWVRPDPDTFIEYQQTFGFTASSLNIYSFNVQAYMGALTDIDAQKNLDLLTAPTGSLSLPTAVESDPTLGGVCKSLQVIECRNYVEFSRPDNVTIIGADWLVQVYA